MGGRWGGRLRDPIFWNDVVQLVKTVVAAVIAWVVAASVLELPQPFLAPWAALLVVHATVYRTFSRGLQQVAGAVVAVLLAALVGNLLGLDTFAVAVLLVLTLAMGSLPWLGAEVTTIAATALVVLTTGFTDDSRLFSRLLDTGIGVGVGLLVNFVVWPPLRRRTAIVAMNRIDDASTGPGNESWPVHGALVINLRNILDAMDEVAEANPLGQPPKPLSGIRLGRPADPLV